MKKIEISRIDIIGATRFFKRPIIKIDNIGEGIYKKIILKAQKEGSSIFTLKEPNQYISDFCIRQSLELKDDTETILCFLISSLEESFKKYGPLNVGLISRHEDIAILEKLVIETCKYIRFLSILRYRRVERLCNKILKMNGLSINIENTIDKIYKKCDIIIDISTVHIY